MAYPQWITPAGNLGIVPSAEYYQYALDAFTTAGTNRYIGLRSGVMFNGNVGFVRVYNRALSASEILQNYNSAKSRFGL